MKTNNIKIAYQNGDSRDALEMALFGYREFKELSLKEKKEVVKELSLLYDKEDRKKVVKNVAVLGNEYGDHLTSEQRYLALREACDTIDLNASESDAIEFVKEEMDSLVGEGNWWWRKGQYVRSILPTTDVFDKEENESEEEED